MSNTRRTASGDSTRQERYASSTGFAKGLLGNLVAKRCATLRDADERALVYFLHELSLRDGFALHYTCTSFPAWPWPSTVDASERAFERVGRELVEMFPARIAESHRERFRRKLPELLTRLCLDPATDLRSAAAPGFDGIIEALREYKARFERAALGKIATTAASRTIFETLDYALSQRGMVLVEGTYRIGKSFAAQAWAQMNLGRCRYVQLVSSPDETSFIRCFARALGVACSPQMKATQMRNRVEETIRRQHLLMVIDEADYCFDGAVKVREAPSRINWIMTALINNGVPVAMIASRNFSRMMAHVEKRCPLWGSEQLIGRIKLRHTLPDDLDEADLFAIAAMLVPEADKPTRMLLVAHALRSQGYVASLESGAARARFFASQAARKLDFADVERVMVESGTHRPVCQARTLLNSLSPSSRDASAKASRKGGAIPAAPSRQPLGAATATTDFTGTRLHGSLP